MLMSKVPQSCKTKGERLQGTMQVRYSCYADDSFQLTSVAAHLKNFGRLHSMRVDLITTRDSSVLEVMGNLHESKIVYAGETHLILAKLRIAKVTKATSHIRESSTSDKIMADLENHLGGAVTTPARKRASPVWPIN